MPQVRVVRSTSGGYNQLPVDVWLPLSPYFWVPLFVVVFAAVVLVLGPRSDRVARRFLAAATLWLALDYGAFAAWQFLGDGWLFNITYYFDSFLVPTFLCLTAAAAVLLGAQRSIDERSSSASPVRWRCSGRWSGSTALTTVSALPRPIATTRSSC